MRGITVASRPGPYFGAMGTLLLVLGIALAVTNDDWIPLLFAAIGAVLLVMAVVAERR
jgi:hypothetical protein